MPVKKELTLPVVPHDAVKRRNLPLGEPWSRRFRRKLKALIMGHKRSGEETRRKYM